MRTFDLPPKVARAVPTVTPGRRVRLALDHVTPRKVYDTDGTVGRHSESREPPTYEANFAERHFAGAHVPVSSTLSPRAFRLWSKTEVK